MEAKDKEALLIEAAREIVRIGVGFTEYGKIEQGIGSLYEAAKEYLQRQLEKKPS